MRPDSRRQATSAAPASDLAVPGRGLGGRTVLVPRGGQWGAEVAERVRARGGVAWVVPLIETRPVATAELAAALAGLEAGDYDWLAVTSAAVAEVLAGLLPAPGTRVAAVGPSTARALERVGLTVDLVPERDHSAAGLLDAWGSAGRVLVLRSDLAHPTLVDGLRDRGCAVEPVVAYRTVPVEVPADLAAAIADGAADAILVTSGSVARRVAELGAPVRTLVACLGPVTAQDAVGCGLRVHAVAAEPTIESLIDALEETP